MVTVFFFFTFLNPWVTFVKLFTQWAQQKPYVG